MEFAPGLSIAFRASSRMEGDRMNMQRHGNLPDQTAPQARKLRVPTSRIRPVSQILVTIPCDDLEEGFREILLEMLRWANNRCGVGLPPHAWEGESFELNRVGALPAEATRLKGKGYYAIKLDYNDRTVPRRNWRTEATIARHEGVVLLGVRLFCVTMGKDEPFVGSVPGLVKQIAENQGASMDGRSIGNGPWIVDEEAEVAKLVNLLMRPDRKHEVCVISARTGTDGSSETLVDAREIFGRTVGAVHVVEVSVEGSYELTRWIGKEFSVFEGAVRTYRLGFDPDTANPYDHPLILAHRISSWDGGHGAFRNLLITQLLRQTVAEARLRREELVPSYAVVKQAGRTLRQRQRRDAARTDKELIELGDEENQRLTEQFDQERADYEELLSEAERELDGKTLRLGEAKSRIAALNARIRHLESARKGSVQDIPGTFKGIEEWTKRELAGRVVVHNRAFRAARKSESECGPDIVLLAYRSLLILRDLYVPMRVQGGPECRERYERGLRQEGLAETATFRGPDAGKWGDEYFIIHDGKRVKLDRHLKKGTDADPRHCFRLYFFWDNDEQLVVVGSFPAHLKNSLL